MSAIAPRSRRATLVALALSAALAVTACGGSDASSTQSQTPASGAAVEAAAPDALPAVDAYPLFEDGSHTLLDVREPEETDAQYVDGSVIIPLGELESRMAELPADKPVLVLCRSGNRAVPAAEMLRAAGYQAVVIDDGIIGWADAGLPYEGSAPA